MLYPSFELPQLKIHHHHYHLIVLRQVFISNRRSQSHKSAYDLVNIKHPSRKALINWIQKNQYVSNSSNSVYDLVTYYPVKTTLSELEAEAEQPTNHKARNQAL